MTRKEQFILFVGTLYYFYVSIQMNQFNSFSKAIIEYFSLTPVQYANISAISLLATVICLFPMGILLDKYSIKKILLATTTVSTLVSFTFAIATHYTTLIIINCIGGIAAAASFPAAIKLAWKLLKSTEIAFITGSIITIGMLGAVLAQFPFMILQQYIGFKKVLFLVGILGIVIILCILLFIPEQTVTKSTSTLLKLTQKIKLVFINYQNWLLALFTAFQNLPIIVLGSVWGTFFLTQYYHYNIITSSTISMMLFVGMIIGSPIAGFLSDQFKNRKKILHISSGISLLLSLSLYFVENKIILIIIFLLIGFFAGFQTLGFTMIAEKNPDHLKASSTSLASIVVISCGVIFQPLFAFILQHTGQATVENNVVIYSQTQFKYAIAMFPCAFLICIVLSIFIRETFNKTR